MKFQHRGLTRTTAPSRSPVTIQQVKDQLKITGDTENENIQLYIDAATTFLEDRLGVSMITQTWQMTLDHWPGYKEKLWSGVRQAHKNTLYADNASRQIELPRYPLQSIASMTVDGTAVTVANVFKVDTLSRPGRIALKLGQVWPVLADESISGIVINFVAGFGATVADVPANLKLAVLRMAGHMFSHRGDGCSTEDAYKNSGARGLVADYKEVRF